MIKAVANKVNRARELGFSQTKTILRDMLAKKMGKLPPVPPTVFIEVTNRCNLTCIMCDRPSITHGKGFMDVEMCKKTIDNAARIGVRSLKLNRFGEPFIYPHLVEMVAYAKKKGIQRVLFTSNATLLTDDKSKRMIEAGLDEIIFSVDGSDEKTYEEIRENGSYQSVVGNIERFCQIKKEMGSKIPRITINTILMTKTHHQMRDIFTKWAPMVDSINVCPVARYGNIDDLTLADRGDFEIRTCNHPFDRLMVFWNGDVTVCCGDINGDLKIGNIIESSLEELWRNPEITKLRNSLTEKNFENLPSTCQKCDGINADVFKHMYQERSVVYKENQDIYSA